MVKRLLSSVVFLLACSCIHVHAPKQVVIRCKVDGKVSLVNLENAELLCTVRGVKK